jgi:hypothetical protein
MKKKMFSVTEMTTKKKLVREEEKETFLKLKFKS